MDATTAKFDAQCVSKMTTAEAFLAKAITRDLGFLAIKPPFGIQKKNKHLDRILQSLVIKQFVSRETQTMEFINPISESILNSKKDEIMQSAKSIEIPLSVNENNVGSSSDENLPGEEMSVEEFLRLREPKELDSNENVSSYFGNALLSIETINSEQGLKPQELQNADSESPIPTIPILVTEKEEEVVAIEQNKSEDPIETSSIHNQVDTATRGEYLDQNLSNESVIEAKSEESPLHNEMPTQPYPDIFEESETPRDIDPTHKVKEESLVVEAQNSTPEIPNPDVDEDNFEEFSQILPPLIDTVHEKKQAEDIHTAGDIATAKIPQFANVWSDNLNDDLQSIKNTNVSDSENIEDDENFMDDDLITPFKLDLNQRDSVAVTERRPYSVSSQAESRTDIPENAEIFGNRESFHSADITPHAGSPIGDAQYNF